MDPIVSFRGEYAFLSNYYNHRFYYDGYYFDTAEAAFAYDKVSYATENSKQLQTAVRTAYQPGTAKAIGRRAKIDLEQWELNKIAHMHDIIEAKFCGELGLRLVNTGVSMLVEGNTWGDTFWGRCDGKGKNILGVLLMEERARLRERL